MRSPAREGESPKRASASFKVRGFGLVWATGGLWHVSRWMAVFVSTYRVNDLTDSPLLVSLVGSAFFAPMFLGGMIAGTISDRFNRRRTVALQLALLIPASALMGTAVLGDIGAIWITYLFVLLVGVGNVVDMTCRRMLALDLVGLGLLTNAMALESLALHLGNMIGSLLGGTILQLFGDGWVYLAVALTYSIALLAFRSARPPEVIRQANTGTTLRQGVTEGLALIKTNRLLANLLVITVVMNAFYYSFFPLIPVFAERLGVGAFLTGLLAAAPGAGTVTGAIVAARVQTTRKGLVHMAGAGLAMVTLICFANLGVYPIALATLYIAGICGSGFGTTQGALVVAVADEAMRGRAMGLLSMAIGGLPFGILILGLLAERIGVVAGVSTMASVGLGLIIAWQFRHPELRDL